MRSHIPNLLVVLRHGKVSLCNALSIRSQAVVGAVAGSATRWMGLKVASSYRQLSMVSAYLGEKVKCEWIHGHKTWA